MATDLLPTENIATCPACPACPCSWQDPECKDPRYFWYIELPTWLMCFFVCVLSYLRHRDAKQYAELMQDHNDTIALCREVVGLCREAVDQSRALLRENLLNDDERIMCDWFGDVVAKAEEGQEKGVEMEKEEEGKTAHTSHSTLAE